MNRFCFPPDDCVENCRSWLVLRRCKSLGFAFFDNELGAVTGTLNISGPVKRLGNHLVAGNKALASVRKPSPI